MARFRKNTLDHDGNGKKGGSLKAGSRFVKGTNDADADGRKGGSLKGDDMAKAPKKAAKVEEAKAAPKPVEAKKAAVEAMFAEAEAKGDPAAEAIAEATLGRQMRGW